MLAMIDHTHIQQVLSIDLFILKKTGDFVVAPISKCCLYNNIVYQHSATV